ncbi:LYR motif-containing protein 2-like protein [Basidiobolus meristosporus CBS 931.73]|uniref:LYR motif-containing protein 2 n=1 Tax=Basidiobolus meristosporus CBS 931.73 TaxID=1314790 RepID=A0A1Y1Y0I7_9FUNG|nr:LYR motif-containing protein 2-like protein [Basidiobolus meristosporus CBS 931.73]|eukprot:ORX91517.1 LYR motif-containing protein 2-like protein [Basidiobolus meristosporus CBS 931.73]
MIPSKLSSSGPNLQHFITRVKVLGLYREIMRATGKIENPKDKKELRDWARADFEHYRNITDQDKIKTLLSQGKYQLHNLQRSLMLSQRL